MAIKWKKSEKDRDGETPRRRGGRGKIAALPEKWLWLIHLACAFLLGAAVFCLYLLSRNAYFPYISSRAGFEQTEEFAFQFSQDMDRALRYTKLKQKLETDGQLEFSKTVETITGEDGAITNISLQDAVDFGASIGLAFDEQNQLVVNGSEGISLQEIRDYSEELDSEETAGPSASAVGEAGTEEKTESAPENQLPEYEINGDGLWQEILTNEASPEEKSVLLQVLYKLAEYYNLQEQLGLSGNAVNFYYRFVYSGRNGDPVVSTNMSSDVTSSDMVSLGQYFTMNSESSLMQYTLPHNTASSLFGMVESNGLLDGGTYEIVAAVNSDFPAADHYREALEDYYRVGILLVILAVGSLAALAFWGLSLAGLFRACQAKRKLFDTWCLEAALAVWLIPVAAAVWAGASIYNGFLMSYLVDVAGGLLILAVAYLPILNGLFSFARRLHSRDFRGSLLQRMGKGAGQLFQAMTANGSQVGRVGASVVLYLFFNVLFIAGSVVYIEERFLGLFQNRWSEMQIQLTGFVCIGGFLLLNSVALVQVLRKASQREKIGRVVRQMAKGDLEQKIDLEGMNGAEKNMAETINTIGDGLSRAVAERTKSERLRTDLIANVSHDLRTPLTSIINYVDLLKRENLPGERVQGYLEVLEQKTQRLRNLTEDLVDASKASSGNVSISWETIDFAQMINQMNGEYQERFDAAGLKAVTTMENPQVPIRTDGRLLFRVLENLYNNVCKYAMPGTRVYIDLKETSHKAVFTMKNISADPLNMDPDELTERFIRGDVSRSTEGSGLGLSIAKSMTEQLKGTFEIYLEGDLFRVRLVFSLAE